MKKKKKHDKTENETEGVSDFWSVGYMGTLLGTHWVLGNTDMEEPEPATCAGSGPFD